MRGWETSLPRDETQQLSAGFPEKQSSDDDKSDRSEVARKRRYEKAVPLVVLSSPAQSSGFKMLLRAKSDSGQKRGDEPSGRLQITSSPLCIQSYPNGSRSLKSRLPIVSPCGSSWMFAKAALIAGLFLSVSANRRFVDFACACDQVLGSCTLNCCCDLDCTSAERALFASSCLSSISDDSVVPSCSSSIPIERTNYMKNYNGNPSLLCVYSDNNPQSHRYYATTSYSLPYDRALGVAAAIAIPPSTFAVPTTDAVYRVGEAVSLWPRAAGSLRVLAPPRGTIGAAVCEPRSLTIFADASGTCVPAACVSPRAFIDLGLFGGSSAAGGHVPIAASFRAADSARGLAAPFLPPFAADLSSGVNVTATATASFGSGGGSSDGGSSGTAALSGCVVSTEWQLGWAPAQFGSQAIGASYGAQILAARVLVTYDRSLNDSLRPLAYLTTINWIAPDHPAAWWPSGVSPVPVAPLSPPSPSGPGPVTVPANTPLRPILVPTPASTPLRAPAPPSDPALAPAPNAPWSSIIPPVPGAAVMPSPLLAPTWSTPEPVPSPVPGLSISTSVVISVNSHTQL